MILDYNATKDGHVTVNWPLAVFYNITDVSANNSYLLWIHCNFEWNARKMYRRCLYLEKLGILGKPQILLRKRLPRPLTSAYFVQKVQSEEQRTSQSIVQTKCIPDVNFATL
ncbi:hypothetical protein T06_14786 [Trichinella sp. T6]|nr:hypothetical protein T06_14786 [Trichinella sp. T6]